MLLIVFTILLKVPLAGIFWFIDELLFSKYHKIIIKEPVFFITGCRSGSTQLSHYLEDDKVNFIAPTVAGSLFSFIWYWKLIVPVLKAAGVINETDRDFSQPQNEFHKRHTVEMHRTGRFDMNAVAWHFNAISLYLGVDFMKWSFPLVQLTESPIDSQFCSSLVQYYDLTVKKVLYHRGTPTQRVFVKGHFLVIANELAQRYKGVKFFTVVREPLDRFKSLINFLKLVDIMERDGFGYAMCPMSWKVAQDYVINTQVLYCTEEKSFYEESQDNKLVIPFNKFVNNLSGTLESVYSFCNIPIPSHVLTKAGKVQNTTHNFQKRRASYDPKFNRSLSSLGVDEDKFRDQLVDYYQWIKQYNETYSR